MEIPKTPKGKADLSYFAPGILTCFDRFNLFILN
jgi:hypothetical protein